MDHSIRGYLEKRTSEELTHILESDLNIEPAALDHDVIFMILQILQKRRKEKDTQRSIP